jgi:hypothetical protein
VLLVQFVCCTIGCWVRAAQLCLPVWGSGWLPGLGPWRGWLWQRGGPRSLPTCHTCQAQAIFSVRKLWLATALAVGGLGPAALHAAVTCMAWSAWQEWYPRHHVPHTPCSKLPYDKAWWCHDMMPRHT